MALVPAISYPVTDASPMLPGVFTGRTEEAAWEATLKFFVRENGGAVLKAANPAYKDIPAGSKLKIIGQLVALLKNPPTVSNYLAHLVHKDISDRKWQYATELATQAGLDGESVANLINMVVKSAKQIKSLLAQWSYMLFKTPYLRYKNPCIVAFWDY